jgi:hypothetical protein
MPGGWMGLIEVSLSFLVCLLRGNSRPFPISPKLIFFLFAGKPIPDTLRTLVSNPSISAGIGLIYKFDPLRVELNLGVPLQASRSDGLNRGVQVGMGLEFL